MLIHMLLVTRSARFFFYADGEIIVVRFLYMERGLWHAHSHASRDPLQLTFPVNYDNLTWH